ncbi:recombinase zinc beta ribbon domain-containing protein [Devosia sp. SL43]|nr:recombinase zinc beta ribbon domain-containing protein [Devosia sp. SL43]
MNPESEWVRSAVPELAIIERSTWDRVQSFRTEQRKSSTKFWEKQRPKYLLSHLLRCGCCGGGVSKISATHYGCGAAREKGPAVCTNRVTVARLDLEHTVLTVLRDRLMDPDLVEVFCKEYVTHLNKLRMERNSLRDGYLAELDTLEVREDRMVRAIMDGFATPKLKTEMDELLARRGELSRLIDNTDEAPVLLHPQMSRRYKTEVNQLIQSLNDDEHRAEATELIRSLVERIVITPSASNFRSVAVDVYGDLAGIINIATDKKTAREPDLRQIRLMLGRDAHHDFVNQGKMVGLEASHLHSNTQGKMVGPPGLEPGTRPL